MSEIEKIVQNYKSFSNQISQITSHLTNNQLSIPIRKGGWSISRIFHHLADAQSMAYYRIKLMLSEDIPFLQPFDPDKWSDFGDYSDENAKDSLKIIEGLYNRWTNLLVKLADEQWKRKGKHPEIGEIDVEFIVKFYDNHGNGHLTRIKQFIEDKGW